MAQLVARLVRNEKVGGSNPPSSTTGRHPIRMSVFCMPGRVGAVPVVVLLVAPLVFRALRCDALWGRAAVCAGGRRPAREPSAPRAALGYRTKRVGFMVTFRLFGAEKSVLKLVGANLKDGQNVLVL